MPLPQWFLRKTQALTTFLFSHVYQLTLLLRFLSHLWLGVICVLKSLIIIIFVCIFLALIDFHCRQKFLSHPVPQLLSLNEIQETYINYINFPLLKGLSVPSVGKYWDPHPFLPLKSLLVRLASKYWNPHLSFVFVCPSS